MEKVIRDGKVAVLYSAGYGAGWTSWGAPEKALFDPTIVELVENNKRDQITDELCKVLFGEEFYTGGAKALEIEWIDQGTAFRITEYDGAEGIELSNETNWSIA